MRVVVAGAGISGLAIAHALRERGMQVTLLEREPVAGGKVRTQQVDGFLCEDGPGSYLDDAASAELLAAAGLGDRVLKASPAAKKRYLCIGGKMIAAPEAPPAFLHTKVISPWTKLRALGEILLPRGPAGRGGDESVASFARRRLGRTMADRMVAAAVSGIFAGDPETLSLPAAFPILAEWERDHRSLILGAVRAARRGRRGRQIASFSAGMQESTDVLAKKLGDDLRVGVRISRVDPTDSGCRVAVEDRGNAAEIAADAVILAIPAYDAADVIGHLHAGASDSLRDIPYAPVAVMHLGFDRSAVEHPAAGFGFLVPPGEGRLLLGVIFSSSLFPSRASSDTLLLTALAGGATNPRAVALSDGELLAGALGELRGVLGLRGEPRLARVVRHERAIPQYTIGHLGRVEGASALEQAHRWLFLAGNAYRGVAFADCLKNAGPLADRVAALNKS